MLKLGERAWPSRSPASRTNSSRRMLPQPVAFFEHRSRDNLPAQKGLMYSHKTRCTESRVRCHLSSAEVLPAFGPVLPSEMPRCTLPIHQFDIMAGTWRLCSTPTHGTRMRKNLGSFHADYHVAHHLICVEHIQAMLMTCRHGCVLQGCQSRSAEVR